MTRTTPTLPASHVGGEGIRFPAPDVRHPTTLLLAAGGHAYRWLTVTTPRDLRDNATFLYDATAVTGRHPSTRLSRAKWRRASARWSLAGVPGALELVQLAAWPTAQISTLLVGSAPGWSLVPWHSGAVGTLAASATFWAGAGIYRGVLLLQRRGARKLERRVALAISRLLGPDADLDNTVRISPGWDDGDLWVEITLPDKWVMGDAAKARLVAQVGARLDFNAPQGEWMTAGARPKVTVRPTPAPPATLLWSEVAGHVRGLDVHHVLFGVGTSGPVVFSYDHDSPHSVFSGAAGKGKSTAIKMLLAQRMGNGVGAIVLDHKNSVAYDYVRDLPSDMARVYSRPELINEVLVLLDRELEWRIAARELDRGMRFRRLDVVIEEGNTFPARMQSWWRKQGKSGEPPCFAARDQLIFMGREYGIHVHIAAQQADTTVFAREQGSSQRINFGIRALAGYEKTTWSMLAYGHEWRPEPDGPVGMWTVVTAKGVDLVRVPATTDAEATRWALRAAGEDLGPLTHGVTLPLTGESLSMSETTADLLLHHEPPSRMETTLPLPDRSSLATLSEWAAETGDTLPNLRRWVSREGLSPTWSTPGEAGLYERAALSRRVPTSPRA